MNSKFRSKLALAIAVLNVAYLCHASTALGLGARSLSPQSGYNKQQQSSKSQKQVDGKDGAVKLNATLVTIPVVVSDRAGKYIPKLTKDDFELSEDGVKQQIAFFSDEEAPFNVALLIDVSQSVSDSLKDIKKAALEFIKQLRPNDRVMVVAFDQQVMFLTDFTSDRKRLESAIGGTQTGRGTSVYEAVYDTVANRFKGIEGRKAILLLSDGEDTTSRKVGYDDTIAKVAQSDVLVYGLRYPETQRHGDRGPFSYPGRRRWPFSNLSSSRGNKWDDAAAPLASLLAEGTGQYGRGQHGQRGQHRRDRGRDFLRDVADAGGGSVYDAKSTGDMGRVARQIGDELRHVYVLSYYPSKSLSGGGYRAIQVRVKGRDDVTIHHRSGYEAGNVLPHATP
jgi:Ca-activated chloride channel family protein